MINENIITPFLNDFISYGDKTAIIWKDTSFSYKHINSRITYWNEYLKDLTYGSVVGLESDFSPETIAILFSLIERNIIVVPFDIHNTEKNTKKKEIAQLDYLIRIKEEEDIDITSVNNAEENNDLYLTLKKRSVPGLVLFTSGSSGEPKAALHDFSKLLSKFSTKRKALLTINFLLFDHWGGLNTLFHILSNGGTVVILENRNPDYICELIEKYKVELLPTSPPS